MRVFKARDTNEMATLVYPALRSEGIQERSRNGDVIRFPTPVTFIYMQPWRRVNLNPHRDCNPFFHLMEAVMMLAGHNCVECMSKFTGNMAQYSDNGKTFNAFYGTRMHQDHQFINAVLEFKRNPNTRQCVIDLWDIMDLTSDTRDKACNMSMVFRLRDGLVDMTVYNRSNDLIYGGVTGANIVHFSLIHELFCVEVNMPLGRFYHVVNDAHVYMNNPLWGKDIHTQSIPPAGFHISLEQGILRDAHEFCLEMHSGYNSQVSTQFFRNVVRPMYLLWLNRKSHTSHLRHILDSHWQQACEEWLTRRDYEV